MPVGGGAAAPWACFRCGYSLEGLAPEDRCPECGLPVIDSRPGGEMARRPAWYLATLRTGAVWVHASILAAVVGVIAWFGLSILLGLAGSAGWGPVSRWLALYGDRVAEITLVVFLMATSVAHLIGWWKLTAADPLDEGARHATSAMRTIARIGAVAVIAGGVVNIVGELVGGYGLVQYHRSNSRLAVVGAALGLAGFGAQMVGGLATFIAGLLLIRWYAVAMASPKLLAMAKFRIWFCPVFAVVGVVLCYLGPLIALVLYYNLLVKLRKGLGYVMRLSVESERSGADVRIGATAGGVMHG